ncbi:DUF4397 domain-containing protein [Paraburkholderia sp.]|uniref:DUF4397 domain-containing protein n=1 Tax=Paraburkholderia sp. TaxID=1926495 RepID=UPI0023932479|nr:DUF4397 domain-containing protein [Paraburkholderia sp.]MDE1183862.1 DUF4397 domain-containing protein [Paraburkholderia sp.]
MKLIRTMAAMVGVASVLAACGGGTDDVGKELGLTNPEIHFIHAIPSGPAVDLLVNGATLSGQTNVSYKGVTNLTNISTGSVNVGYAATGTTTALASSNFPNVAKGHEYTVLALPALTGSDIGLIDDPFDKGLLSNSARIRGFNASANAQNLDIYLAPAGTTSVTSLSPTMTGVQFKSAVPASGQDSLYVSGGNYVLLATASGDKTVIYQSDTFTLGNNADWLITTVPIAGALSQLLPGQIHMLIAQAGNTTTPAIELSNALTGS